MKKLLILPLLVLLTGCVTYYYPETALEDGVYYAEDDPSYVVDSGGYAGVAYYPWSSLDYFYLGYNPYPAWSFGYGYNSGFSVGFSYGYSPWYYPYNNYGYYSPWYASHYYYPHYPAWRPYRGYCSHHNACGYRNKDSRHRDRNDRYARNGNKDYDRHDRSGGNSSGNRRNSERRNQDSAGSHNTSVRRYVSTAPAGYSNNRGMVIRNNESTKIGKSRIHPDKSVSVDSVKATSPKTRTVQPDYRTKRTANEVRYRSDAKQGRSRTEPVSSGSPSRSIQIAAVPSGNERVTGHANRSGLAVRTNASRATSARPPSNSNSRPATVSRPKASSKNSNRSGSSSNSGNRSSKNSGSSHRKDRR